MWISRKEWCDLKHRVEELEFKLRYLAVYVEQDDPVNQFSSGSQRVELVNAVRALINHAGLRWNPGEPGKLVSGKKVK